jgi:hypothetical protein
MSLLFFVTIVDKRSILSSSSSSLRISFLQGRTQSSSISETSNTLTSQREQLPPKSNNHYPTIRNNFKMETILRDTYEEQHEQQLEDVSTSEDESDVPPKVGSDDKDGRDISEDFLEDKGPVVYSESETETNSEPLSNCDALPLHGGRYFWRNRRREVDKDKSQICGPKILIIGSPRCGTTMIADMLIQHPRIQFNSCNLKNTMGGCNEGWFQGALKQDLIFEGNDFTLIRKYIMPNGWLDEFGKRLPWTDGVTSITFDKSTTYMDVAIFPEVVDYAKAHLPNAKIIASLCNPAERLYSEFNALLTDEARTYQRLYQDNQVDPPTTFDAFVKLFDQNNPICKEKEGFCNNNRAHYLRKGEFLNNLRPWIDAYGNDNVLMVNMDEEPTTMVKQLLNFVGTDLLPESEYPWDVAAEKYQYTTNANMYYEGRTTAYDHFNDEMSWLEEYYAPHNEDLANYLDAGWPRQWNCRLDGSCTK